MGQWLWQATKFAVRLAKFAFITLPVLCVSLGMAALGRRALLLCLSSWRAPQEALAPRWSRAKEGAASLTRHRSGGDSVTQVLLHPAGKELREKTVKDSGTTPRTGTQLMGLGFLLGRLDAC